MQKRLFCIVILVIVMISLSSCTGSILDYYDVSQLQTQEYVEEKHELDWVIYWYLCGSDLETLNGSATADLLEMIEVELPENVAIVIQTGGAKEWQNEEINPNVMQRWVYDVNGLQLIESLESKSMGDEQVLKEFLTFAEQTFPAKRTMLNFWNHGGGSVTGVAFDELYGFDSLTLDEIYRVFSEVYTQTEEYPPLDIIGFDSCLMATIDTAWICSDFAQYMVASEEIEPDNGWYYPGFLEDLSKNTDISALDLSISIADHYLEGCKKFYTHDDATLSVTDLSQVEQLVMAHEEFGKEALAYAAENPSFFTQLGQVANRTKNYGGNTREQGFTNMIDLGDLAANTRDILTNTADQVLDALEQCVVYKVAGPYQTESKGLSTYYSYNGSLQDFQNYVNVGVGDAFKYLYTYELTGTLTEEGLQYLNAIEYLEEDIEQLNVPPSIHQYDWDGIPLTVVDGCATLELGTEAKDTLSSVVYDLSYVDYENDLMYSLGYDNDIDADWETGTFKENFRGVWGAIDGHLVYMELAYDGDTYNEYTVPILLNKEAYNLTVYYQYETEEWEIGTARKPLSENGAADKNARTLEVGDEIQTLHYVTNISGDADYFEEVAIDTFVVTEETSFGETSLEEGMYLIMFLMEDSAGNSVYSGIAASELTEDAIYTYVD